MFGFRLLRFVVLVAVLAAAAIGFITQPWVTPLPSPPSVADAARLQADVKHLSVDLHPRSYDQQDNTARVVQFIRGELEKTGATPWLQVADVQRETYHNVIARYGPATGPLLVIGAHYDTYGEPGSRGTDCAAAYTPGADDNASGVAGLLELARLLGKSPPTRPVELVAYALEEPPHFRTDSMGSAVHARALRDEKREVELMLSLEMIGYFSDEPDSQSYPFPGMSALYSDKGDFITVVGRFGDFAATRRVKALMRGAGDLPVHSINAPTLLQGIDFSDHLNYWQQGFPALMITDTAFLRNPNYHCAADTYEKLDYARMAKVVQAVYAVTRQP